MRSVTVVAAIVIENGKVLVSRRKSGGHLAGAWEFPGGKVEPGEDPREALRRELEEELGIAAHVGEVLDVTFHRYAEIEKAVTLLFFEAFRQPHSPEPRSIDVAEFCWSGADELDPSTFPPADLPVLSKVIERLRQG